METLVNVYGILNNTKSSISLPIVSLEGSHFVDIADLENRNIVTFNPKGDVCLIQKKMEVLSGNGELTQSDIYMSVEHGRMFAEATLNIDFKTQKPNFYFVESVSVRSGKVFLHKLNYDQISDVLLKKVHNALKEQQDFIQLENKELCAYSS